MVELGLDNLLTHEDPYPIVLLVWGHAAGNCLLPANKEPRYLRQEVSVESGEVSRELPYPMEAM